jgi:hypothetical protein
MELPLLTTITFKIREKFKTIVAEVSLTHMFSAWAVGKVQNVPPAVPSDYTNILMTNKA